MDLHRFYVGKADASRVQMLASEYGIDKICRQRLDRRKRQINKTNR